jgi:gliding motility-associated lipoprotein GldH
MANLRIKNAGVFTSALILLLIISSCSKSYFYQSEVKIPGAAWSSEKIAIFEPVISDTSQSYNVILSVSNTDDYRYSNIWFFIKTISPDGNSQKDTVQYLMAEESGKWIGNENGDNYEQKFYFKNFVRFPKTGKYAFEIQQGMRDLELKGITKVGIILEEINKN